jgi:hypothetical protein
MLSVFLKIFDVFREHRRIKAASSREFLDDLVTFCSDSGAAMSEVYLALERDAGGERSNATITAILSLQKLDATAQRLQLRARTAFPDSDIPALLFELLRRISLAKQSLFMAETAYIRAAFFADRQWIQYQVHRTLIAAARAANINVTDPDLPFLVGFDPASKLPGDNSDASGQPPSAKIESDYHLQKVKAQWEAAGHDWLKTDSACDQTPYHAMERTADRRR